MNKSIQLRLFCSDQYFRSEFAARLLTYYGTSKNQTSLSEDDMIEKLENSQLEGLSLNFFIDEFEFEVMWKDQIEVGKANKQTIFLLLLELEQQIPQELLQSLQDEEIEKNCFLVIVDKVSVLKKDTEIQSYENDIINFINSNLNVLIDEMNIFTVLFSKPEKCKTFICDKLKEVAKNAFEIKCEIQNNQSQLDVALSKMCQQYSIENVEEFIKNVKTGDFQTECSKVKDRKGRKKLMEQLQSFVLLNQCISQNKQSEIQIDSEIKHEINESLPVTTNEQNEFTKDQNHEDFGEKQQLHSTPKDVKQALRRICEQYGITDNKIETCIEEILSADFDSAKLNVKKSQRSDFIAQCKDCPEYIAHLKSAKEDSLSQFKSKVSQDLVAILKDYVADPEDCLECLLEDKMQEALEEVKKVQQQKFLQKIQECQSYQQFLRSHRKLDGVQPTIIKKSSQTNDLSEDMFVKESITKGEQTLSKVSPEKEETKTPNENGDKYVGETKNGLRDGKGVMFYVNGDKYEGEWKNDRKDGKGIFIWGEGERKGNKYEGEFKDDRKEGKGTMFFVSGNKYEGEWKNGEREGKGTFIWANGNKYEGEFKNGIREGRGIYEQTDGRKYQGEWKNDKKEGKGKMVFVSGNRYEGDWKNGEREGKGTIFYVSGNKYEGEWKNGKREGKGTILCLNGDKYEGEWKNDKKEGKGVNIWANGKKYEGEFKDDKIEGKGIIFYTTGNRYEGECKNGIREGKGIFIWKDGDKYEGEWKNDKREGKGTMFYVSGNKYEGDWKSDIKEGKGTYIWGGGPNKGDVFKGEWKNDKKEGKGIYIWAEGTKYEGEWKNGEREGRGTYFYTNGQKYEGEWKNGVKEGKGIFFYANGHKYEGELKSDKREGKGTYVWTNGNRYEGEWKNELQEGKGTMFYADGNKYVGEWKNDIKEGKGIFFYANGELESQEWKNGKLV